MGARSLWPSEHREGGVVLLGELGPSYGADRRPGLHQLNFLSRIPPRPGNAPRAAGSNRVKCLLGIKIPSVSLLVMHSLHETGSLYMQPSSFM